MRQWDDGRASASGRNAALGSDQLAQRQCGQKTFDRESSHWYQQLWPDNSQFGVEPVAAPHSLFLRWNSIATTAWMRSGETARDCRDVDFLSSSVLIEAGALEPTEERAAGAAGEGHTSFRLHFSRRLPNQHRPRIPRARGDRRNPRGKHAAPTRQQGLAVSIQSNRCSDSSHRVSESGDVLYYTSLFLLLPQVPRRVEMYTLLTACDPYRNENRKLDFELARRRRVCDRTSGRVVGALERRRFDLVALALEPGGWLRDHLLDHRGACRGAFPRCLARRGLQPQSPFVSPVSRTPGRWSRFLPYLLHHPFRWLSLRPFTDSDLVFPDRSRPRPLDRRQHGDICRTRAAVLAI